MPSTVIIECLTGVGGMPQTITNHRFNLGDTPVPGLTNPLRVPTSGTADSWWCSHRAKYSGAYTELSDFKLSSSGSIASAWALGTGGMVRIGTKLTGDSGCPDGSYQQAGGTTSPLTGYALDDVANGHAYYNNPVTDLVDNFDNYPAATPLLIDSGPYGPNVTGNTKHWCLQCRYGSDTAPGDRATQTVTLTWAEI